MNATKFARSVGTAVQVQSAHGERLGQHTVKVAMLACVLACVCMRMCACVWESVRKCRCVQVYHYQSVQCHHILPTEGSAREDNVGKIERERRKTTIIYEKRAGAARRIQKRDGKQTRLWKMLCRLFWKSCVIYCSLRTQSQHVKYQSIFSKHKQIYTSWLIPLVSTLSTNGGKGFYMILNEKKLLRFPDITAKSRPVDLLMRSGTMRTLEQNYASQSQQLILESSLVSFHRPVSRVESNPSPRMHKQHLCTMMHNLPSVSLSVTRKLHPEHVLQERNEPCADRCTL